MSGPLQVLHYRLTPADALAWERLPREVQGWRKLGFFAPWMVLGMAWALSEPLPGLLARGALAGGAGIAAWLVTSGMVARTQRRRARQRISAPTDMRCTIWADRLEIGASTAGETPAILTPDSIRQVIPTPERLFIDAVPALLILPRAAFDDAAQMAAFAAHWDQLSRLSAD